MNRTRSVGAIFFLIASIFPITLVFSQSEIVMHVLPQDELTDGMSLEGPKVMWKAKIDKTLSEGVSGEIVTHAGVVYVPLRGKGPGLKTGYVCAISADTGAVKWVRNIGSVGTGLVYDAGAILCGTHDGKMHALDALSGESMWQKKTQNWHNASIKTRVASDEERIYFGYDDGFFYALDRMTGEQRWDYPTKGIIYAEPILFEDKIFFGSSAGEFTCLIKETGEEVWSSSVADGIFFLNILIEDGRVVSVWCKDDKSQERVETEALHYTAFDLASGDITWSSLIDSREAASWPISADGLIFQTSGTHLTARNFSDGEEAWSVVSENIFFPSVEIIDDMIVAANGAEFNYAGTGSSFVYAFDYSTGDIRWQHELPNGITRGLRPSSGVLSATSSEVDAAGQKRDYLIFLDAVTGDEYGRVFLKTGEHIRDYSATHDGTYYVSVEDEESNAYIYKITYEV